MIKKTISAHGIRFLIEIETKEVARATLFIMTNGLHKRPFGFIEDVYVAPDYRKKKLASRLVKAAIIKATEENYYKLILTIRFGIEKKHIRKWYSKFGFKNHGFELRMNL